MAFGCGSTVSTGAWHRSRGCAVQIVPHWTTHRREPAGSGSGDAGTTAAPAARVCACIVCMCPWTPTTSHATVLHACVHVRGPRDESGRRRWWQAAHSRYRCRVPFSGPFSRSPRSKRSDQRSQDLALRVAAVNTLADMSAASLHNWPSHSGGWALTASSARGCGACMHTEPRRGASAVIAPASAAALHACQRTADGCRGFARHRRAFSVTASYRQVQVAATVACAAVTLASLRPRASLQRLHRHSTARPRGDPVSVPGRPDHVTLPDEKLPRSPPCCCASSHPVWCRMHMPQPGCLISGEDCCTPSGGAIGWWRPQT